RMKRLSPRAMRRRAHVRPTIRLFLEALERREAATDVLNMAAGLGVMASLYAGAAVTPGDPGVIPGVDAVLGAADKPALWDRIPILSTAVAKADEVSVAKQTPSEPPPQSAAAQTNTPLVGQQFFVTLGGSQLADPFVDPLGQSKPKEVSADAGSASAPAAPSTPGMTDGGGGGGGGGGESGGGAPGGGAAGAS